MQESKPSTGGGLFDVDQDPAAGEMVATVRIAFKFTTGNPLDPTWFAAIGGLAAFAARGFKAEDFIWTDEEKFKWRTQAVSDIQSVWSERYTFFTKKPYWEVRSCSRPASRARSLPRSATGATST
ncbi:MAG: hypothetical protein M3Q31_02445 [Actinomycetota bacterium]|nr:hypothetical protein [Actinomycetota bacterium]